MALQLFMRPRDLPISWDKFRKKSPKFSIALDGKIGPKTQEAIKNFQKASNIKADGVIGEKTKSLLMKHLPEEVY